MWRTVALDDVVAGLERNRFVTALVRVQRKMRPGEINVKHPMFAKDTEIELVRARSAGRESGRPRDRANRAAGESNADRLVQIHARAGIAQFREDGFSAQAGKPEQKRR